LHKHHDVSEDGRSSHSSVKDFFLKLNHSEDKLNSIESLHTERDVVHLVNRALDSFKALMISFQDVRDCSNLLLEDIN